MLVRKVCDLLARRGKMLEARANLATLRSVKIVMKV